MHVCHSNRCNSDTLFEGGAHTCFRTVKQTIDMENAITLKGKCVTRAKYT